MIATSAQSLFTSTFIVFVKTSHHHIKVHHTISTLNYNSLQIVKNLEIYLQLAQFTDSDSYLFQKVSKCKDKFSFRNENKPMSYTRMREIFIDAFSPFVDNIKSYGLHSLRSGGASSAANFGIPDRLFKTAKDGYVKDSLSERLTVSQNLGL